MLKKSYGRFFFFSFFGGCADRYLGQGLNVIYELYQLHFTKRNFAILHTINLYDPHLEVNATANVYG